MNAISRDLETFPGSHAEARMQPLSPAALARLGGAMSDQIGNRIPSTNKVLDYQDEIASKVGYGAEDLALLLPAATLEDSLAQLCILMGRFNAAVASEPTSAAELVAQSAAALERCVVSLARIAGVDILPFGAEGHCRPIVLEAAGFRAPFEGAPA